MLPRPGAGKFCPHPLHPGMGRKTDGQVLRGWTVAWVAGRLR